MIDKEIKKATLLDEESISVQSHLQILQNVISRMSSNSSSCKAWCITLVTAILVLVADKNNIKLAWFALLPTILFFSLDAYYLALEKAFRFSYNNFVRKLHSKELTPEDLFWVVPKGKMIEHEKEALKSFSVWGFYGTLLVLILLLSNLVFWAN